MTKLRVYRDFRRRRIIEISSADSQLSHAVFVPLLPSDLQFSLNANPSEFVEVRFGDEALRVAFRMVLNRPRERLSRYRLLGTLEETDSSNIINHLLDILAFP